MITIIYILLLILLIVLVSSVDTNTNRYDDDNDGDNNNNQHRKIATSIQHSSVTNNFHSKGHPFVQVQGTTVKHVPSIFVLGVQKGGSSSLYEFLIQHPMLCGGMIKDPHFFDHNYKKGRSHYESYYTDTKCEKHSSMYVDGSSMMHNMDLISPRMSEFYTPEEKSLLRFIVLLREPVSRDYSWYSHVLKRDLADGRRFDYIKTFKEMDEAAVKANSTAHRTGRYVTQLSQFIQYFNRNQILIINSDSLFSNSTQHMESIRNFLNLPKYKPWETGKFPKEEPYLYAMQLNLIECVLKHVPALDCDFRDLLGQYYHPYNKKLDEWIDKTTNRSKEELHFPTFGQDHKKLDCVADARALYEKILSKERERDSKQRSCISKS